MNAAPRHVWILDEGSQGHVVQSRGLVRELAGRISVRHEEIPVRCLLTRHLDRSWAKRLLRWHPKPWMFRLLYPDAVLPAGKPDLILSSGPRSLAPLVYLSKHFDCPSIFVQGTIDVPPGAVTCIVRPFEGKHREDFVFIPLLFCEITPGIVREAAERFLSSLPSRPAAPLNALFIGESTKKIRFEPSDWQALVDHVNASWTRDGKRWLVSTSYRTSVALERFLKESLRKEAIFDAVWYSEAPRSITREFMGAAAEIYVTMDSLTMMTEAVSSGARVHLVCPEQQLLKPENSHHRYILGLLDAGYLDLFRGTGSTSTSTTTAAPDYDPAIRQILSKIGWKP